MVKLIPLKETLEIEFKSDKTKLPENDLIEAIVAFANTNGGDLYLGIEDNGTVSGLHKEHQDITKLGAYIANKTVPPIAVRLDIIYAEHPVLQIHVNKSRSIVATSSGKILRRRIKPDGTPENIPMYPYEIATRLSDLSLLDFSAQPVPGAQYADLDPLERERLRRIILAYGGEQHLLELSDEELDKALQLVISIDDSLIPTYAGLLLLGRSEIIHKLIPTAEAAILEMNGTDVSLNESFYLPLLAGIEKIFSFIAARNPQQEMNSGLFRISIPEFDERAVREALINAFAHRDYTKLGRVIVHIDADGLTISNPGGFIEGVTIKNILSADPHGRNPVLADALKRIGLAERSGRGVDRIFEGSLRYGRDLPDYSETSSTTVKLFIPRGMPDKHLIQLISKEQERIGAPLPLTALFALNALRDNRRMSTADICSQCNIPEVKMHATLERLTESGLIEAIGNGRGRVYVLGSKVYKNPVKYVRQTDIDAIRYEELVLKLADKKKTIMRKDVIELLHVTPPQAYRLLKKMTEKKLLILEGTTSAAKYRKA